MAPKPALLNVHADEVRGRVRPHEGTPGRSFHSVERAAQVGIYAYRAGAVRSNYRFRG